MLALADVSFFFRVVGDLNHGSNLYILLKVMVASQKTIKGNGWIQKENNYK